MGTVVAAHVRAAFSLLFDWGSESPAPQATALADWLLVDAALCAALAVALVLGLPRLIERRLGRPEEPGYADPDALDAGAEAMGLGISFWALLKWKFRADPFFVAERRSLWSQRRVAALWGLLSLAGVVALVLAAQGHRRNEEAGALLREALAWLPMLIATAVTAVGLSGERASGALESVLLTPTAPLRLVAAKLMGRTSRLLSAAVILVLLAFIAVGVAMGDSREWAICDEHQISRTFRELVLAPLAVLAAGAAGLYGAARFRSMVGALVAGYGLTALLGVVLLVGAICTAETSKEYGWRPSGETTAFGLKAVVFLIEVLLLGALGRVWLMSAARRPCVYPLASR
jgi:hypothetical protein